MPSPTSFADLILYAAASALLLYEMDAIEKRERQLLFVFRRLPDEGP